MRGSTGSRGGGRGLLGLRGGVSRGGDSLRIAGINDWTGEENGDPANLQTALADRADGGRDRCA